MGEAPLVALVVVGIVVFIVGLSVLKAIMSRGPDRVLDLGMKTVNKARNDEVAQAVAVPLVLKSAASVAEIAAALDVIVNAKKSAPGFGVVVYESARTDDKITYAMGNQFYPQQLVAEVRFGERDGMTQVVFKVLHLPEKNGMYAAADPMMLLRESVECAVNAVGDPDKIAEGVRLYGPPEPGSPRAIANRNKMILVWAGSALIIAALFKFGTGFYLHEVPLWAGVAAAGGFLLWFARRMDRRRLSGSAADAAAERADVPEDALQPRETP